MGKDYFGRMASMMKPEEKEKLIYFAEISSIKPLKIKINNQEIKQDIFETTGFSYDFNDSVFDDVIITDSMGGTHSVKPKSWFSFLKEWHKKEKLKVGDVVICVRNVNEFYILAKVRK